MDLIKEAREIVRTNPLTPKTASIRNCADDLHEAYGILCVSCTRDAITRFTATVTRTIIAIERFQAGDDPGPKSGAGERGPDVAQEHLDKTSAAS